MCRDYTIRSSDGVMFFIVVSVTFYFSSWLQVVTCYSHCLSTKVHDLEQQQKNSRLAESMN